MRLREKPMRERKRTAVRAAPSKKAGRGKLGNVCMGFFYLSICYIYIFFVLFKDGHTLMTPARPAQ